MSDASKKVERKCSECEKTIIHCKGMCQACYSRAYRKTESGYCGMRQYNLQKGKEAQKRYRDKNKRIRPPKTPKIARAKYPSLCKCGKDAFSKGLCSACYQKDRYAKMHPTHKNKIDFLPIFQKVLDDVKNGYTIIHSLSVLNFNSRTFYNNMTEVQKAELHSYKITSKKMELDFDDEMIEP